MPLKPSEFLARILPADGWKCALVYKDNKPQQRFAETFAELEKIILHWDALGSTVYHGCASYKNKGDRKASNVAQVKSFWLDIDAGPGKPYATRDEAEDALDDFLEKTGLPEPLVVSSGVGLHVYWPFEEPVTPGEWKSVAENLKALAKQHGLHAGAERTADVASILRPPGTHHRKDPSNVRTVGVIGAGSVTTFSELRARIQSKAPRTDAERHQEALGLGGSQPALSRADTGTATSDFLGGLDGPPANPDQIADQCDQLGFLRRQRGAETSEPFWHTCINALVYCEEGLEVAHEWSDGDPRYDEAEVDAKFARIKATVTGPATCQRFEDLRPEGCAGCPHRGKITTPVELGRGARRIETTIAQVLQQDPTFSVQTLPALIRGFQWSSIGQLTFQTEDSKSNTVNVTVTNYPVIIHAMNRGEIAKEKHSVVVRYWRPHEGWAETEMLLSDLFGSSAGSKVAGLGIMVHNPDYWRIYLRDSVDALTSKEKTRVQYEQFGWKDEETSFLVGSRLYRANDALDIAGSQEVMHRARHLRPGGERKRGSLLQWKAAADRFGAPGAEPQMVALMMSLGAPLMRFFGEDEGGMVLSLVSSNTGTGKSTALDAAASVWGDLKGLQMVAIDTRVAQGLTLAVCGNLPVIFDELRQRDPEALRDFIQMFTQGRDKLRGTSDGQLIHNAGSWQTFLICGSNKSLVDTIASAKGSEAMNARILEFHLPGQEKGKTDQTLRKQFNDNAGFAGEMFIKAIVSPANRDHIKAALETCQTTLIKQYHLGSEHRFLVRGVSCMYVAALVASTIGVVSLTPQRLLDWTMREALMLYEREQVEGEEPGENVTMGKSIDPLALLAEFMNENLDATLIVADPWRHGKLQVPQRQPQRKILMRFETNPQRVFISARDLRDWLIKRDMNTREFMASLQSRGVFEGKRMCTLTAGTDVPGLPVETLMFTTKNRAIRAVLNEPLMEKAS